MTFKYLKELGKERKMLIINLDKGVIVNEIGRFLNTLYLFLVLSKYGVLN